MLSNKSRNILECLSKGLTHDDLILNDIVSSCSDISSAVKELLTLYDNAQKSSNVLPEQSTSVVEDLERWTPDMRAQIKTIRMTYPRAYTSWDDIEENRLLQLHNNKVPILDIARILQRQESAIQSRLQKIKSNNKK